MKTATEIVKKLGMTAHPEGGWFVETYRASETLEFSGSARAVSTAIYFLLEHGQRSAFHRIDADEMWHHYEGCPIQISILDAEGLRTETVGAISEGHTPQCWVPGGVWFAAEPLGDKPYGLVGCTVAPGFDFSAFEMASRASLIEQWPAYRNVIEKLT